MPSLEPVVLACGADDNYAMPLAVTLHSTLVHLSADRDVVVCIIDGGIAEERRAKLEQTVECARPGATLVWHEPDMADLGDLWVAGHVTAAAYFSLLVPEAVPDSHGKAIYLDSDLLVEGDVAELWRVPLEGCTALAVQDYLIPYLGWPGGPRSLRSSEKRGRLPYYNCGVVVFDLTRWRSGRLSELVFRYLREHADELTFRDQEGLNAVLVGDMGSLDPKWNVSTSLLWLERWPESPFKQRMRGMREELLDAPGIWHFTGPSKPWHADFTHPAAERWHRHREQAGWPTSPTPGSGADVEAWLEDQRQSDRDIAAAVPANAALILVSDTCRLPVSVEGRRALPFLESGGVYQGNPLDDDAAIRELDRMRRSGSRFLAFDRSTFWWLEYYHGFADHLRAQHSCVRETDRVVVFELRA